MAAVGALFLGSAEIPLTADEYRQRARVAGLPCVVVHNPSDTETLRVDVLDRRGECIGAVLLLPREACDFPTVETLSYRHVPAAFVHAPT